MNTAHGNLHLEIQTSRKRPVGVLRTSYREDGKVKHTQHGRITGCTLPQLRMLQMAFKEQVVPTSSSEAFEIVESKEYGASAALLALVKSLGLPSILYSRNEDWVKSALAMIIGRIMYPGSKLSLCNQHTNSCLWTLCGIDQAPDVDMHCYPVMDKLLNRQKAIQRNLAKQHLQNHHMVLYDITSVYFEGNYTDSDLVTFGYNRDGKKGKEQVVVGLICNNQGCPVGVEIFAGNTKDETTVLLKIREIKEQYGLQQVIFVGDRGMVTRCNLDALQDDDDVKTITALTHSQLQQLLDREVVQLDLFDRDLCREVQDPDTPHRRYCLCRNEATKQRERQTRQRLLDLTEQALQQIANYKRKCTLEKLGARVGKALAKYKMGKLIDWHIEPADDPCSTEHKLCWTVNQEKLSAEEQLDGCYVITTDIDSKTMDTQRVINTYKSLAHVEQAFKHLKGPELAIRPVYHKQDNRIRSHIFLCMLAYYVQWHLMQRLKPLLATDGNGKKRRWTWRSVIDSLKQITRNKIRMGKVIFYRNSTPTPEQQMILDLLKVAV